MKILTLHFNIRLFIYLSIGFIICTAAGTLSHEGGHCIVAKILGQDVRLHYASMNHINTEKRDSLKTYFNKHRDKIRTDKSSQEFHTFQQMYSDYVYEDFLVILGGPVQTMLTGTIGFAILWLNRKKIYRRYTLPFAAWVSIFLAFFWSRQLFNFIFSLDTIFTTQKIRFRSDEPRLSLYMDLPHWAFGLAAFITGSLIVRWVVFKVIPIRHRLTFILAGLAGSAAGWYLWMDKFGPVILP